MRQDGGTTSADRLMYLMAVKMTTMGKGEWRAMDKSSLLPFKDVFPGSKKFVMSPVFMSRLHTSWERLKAAMREMGLGCYKKKAANTHVPSLLIATLYSMQMCRRVNVYGAKQDLEGEEAEDLEGSRGEGGDRPTEWSTDQPPLTPAARQSSFRERDNDCCYYPHVPPFRSDAPTCNHLARRVALRLLAVNNRVTLK